MSGHNQKIGAWGESVAAEYLKERGHVIIARNVRTPYGEIDIVAEKGGFTIFVEVKTRTSGSLGPPEISVTPRKQEHMIAAAEHYAKEHEIDHWQIDVIAVEGKPGKKSKITHFENAI
jgi:putative endonuclease